MLRHIEEMVVRQVHRSESAQHASIEAGKVCKNSIVTISRTMGSGARIVANKLAQRLGWSLWDKELLDAMAQDANVSRRVVDAFDEKTMSQIDLLVRHVLGDHELGEFLYPVHLARAVAAVARLGNAIILGRGANFVAPEALNIRMDASFEHRVRNMMSYEDLPHAAAEVKIRESDRERCCFLIKTFGKEKVQNARYDLTLWMDEFSTDDAVEIIAAAVKVRCQAPAKNPAIPNNTAA